MSDRPKLECPNCGSTGNFEHLETVDAIRSVIGFNNYGQLEINGLASMGEGENDDRLACGSCGKEFPLPTDIEVEYV